MAGQLLVCVDVGSTFTKAALVDVADATVVAAASHPTTSTTDVMAGVDACLEALGATGLPVLACSSAGGGLRIAVVGNEQLVTAEAGRRVALSSGGHVVTVLAGGLDEQAMVALRQAAPDVVLLAGGTDGGNTEAVLADARMLAGRTTPVVVACNRDAADEVAALLAAAGTPCTVADNVLPRIGVLEPGPARAALRRVFLSHVIGGKHLSVDHRFRELVQGATPDVVLQAVELLARGTRTEEGVGGIVVVDVGGATTDVYSVVPPTPDDEHGDAPDDGRPASREVLGDQAVTRTVEGDLGVRWSAPGTVAAAVEAGWVDEPDVAMAAAVRRREDPSFVPESDAELDMDVRLAGWALGLAVRRHAGRAQARYEASGPSRGRWLERPGTDLRTVELVVGSGGVLRRAVHCDPALTARFLAHLDSRGGWQVPRAPRFVVDVDYVCAPAGLLATDHPDAAWSLLAPLHRAEPSRDL